MAKLKPLRNGRSAKKVGAFSQIEVEMQRSPAFRTLAASAHRLLLWCLFKNYKAATADEKTSGRPVFKLTNSEARAELGMNQQTFTRAKQELADKGFIVWITRGGLSGCNGVASKFSLAGGWKVWIEPPKERRKPPTPMVKSLNSVKST